MELINTNNEYSFDPTPKLKSSPIPIEFISFNKYDNKCIHCGEEYTETLLADQKYCKKCLSHYISNINDNHIYLDTYLYTKKLECVQHEINKTNEPQNIQECCRNCFEIICFKQIQISTNYFNLLHPTNPYFDLYKNVLESEKHCKLCGKSLSQQANRDFRLCSDCYLISSGSIKSIFTEQSIPIIYLPWWHSTLSCEACKLLLVFTSDCQKYCKNCLKFYTGCRYCLTTNVIFGPTNQSQCKKCKRVTTIIFDVAKISSGNRDLDDFLLNLRLDIYNNLKITKFADKVKNTDKYFLPESIYSSIYQNIKDVKILMEWIPYSRITNIKEIAKGGFGIIYQATWLGGSINENGYRSGNQTVILKRFINSKDIDKYFLNEVNILTLTLFINV
jgi:hypothetical protein